MSSSASSLREDLANMLADFAGQGKTLTIPRPYLDLFEGDHLKALFFSQLLYWSGKGKWFYKSYVEWDAEIGLSAKQVRRITKELCDEGIVETAVTQEEGAPTTHYRVCREHFGDWIVSKKSSVRLCPEGTIDCALREDSNVPSGHNHPYVALESVHESKTLDSPIVPNPSQTTLTEDSIRWVGQRFRTAGRKLGTADRRVMVEWLGELQHSEEEVEVALGQFFLDSYWREKNFPPDAFRKQFEKYLDSGTRPTSEVPQQLQTHPVSESKPSLPARDFPTEWNSVVYLAPVVWDTARSLVSSLKKCAKDPVFCERFSEVCVLALKCHANRPGEVGWLSFEWIIKQKPGEAFGWWRLLNDMRWMSEPPVQKKSELERMMGL